MILGVDPGNHGALVYLTTGGSIYWYTAFPMTDHTSYENKKQIDHDKLREMVLSKKFPSHIICELPTSYGMLPGSAFHYGYNFGLMLRSFPPNLRDKVEFVKPQDWAKVMHEGMDKGLKAKAKSERLFNELFGDPKEVFPDVKLKIKREGLIDAALIAEYYRRDLSRGMSGRDS